MEFPAPSTQFPIEELVEQILLLGTITRTEESRLFALLSSNSITDEQRAMIQRVFYGLRHELLKLVD